MGNITKRAPVQIDEVLEGRYKILKLLAEGGMGSVYLAEHLMIRRRVAIKVLHPHLATDAHVVDCFVNEARAAGMLGHANIVESTDMGFTREHIPYIVFEYLEGALLTDEIYRVNGMPMHRAVRIAEQIAAALHVAHESGIVHRDLKSDNIFLTDKAEASDHVKVIDFGISRFMNDNSQRAMVAGTPEFMAPEQMTDPENVDRRADIYALGVILYEMLTARRPFVPGKDTEALQRQILSEAPPPMNRAGIPQGLIELVDRMLAKHPGDRPQTMSYVVAALDAFMTHADGAPMPRRRSTAISSVRPEDLARETGAIPPPRAMLDTPVPQPHASMMMAAPQKRWPLYTVAGLSLVVGGLGVVWGLKGSSAAEQPVVAKAPPPAPVVSRPAAAIPPPPVAQPAKIAVSVESDIPGAHVTFRRHSAASPMSQEIATSEIVELVEVSAPGYKTERYWLTLDRATHLKAHLSKGSGLDEASEEATLIALGEMAAPTPAIAVAIAPKQELKAPAKPVAQIAERTVDKTVAKPVVEARMAPRKIGRAAEAPTPDKVEEPRPAFVDAPTPAPTMPAVEAPKPAPAQTMPVAEAPAPVEAPVPTVVTTKVVEGPHNISPVAFKAMVTSGNLNIDAPITTAKEMVRDSKAKVTAAVKTCIGNDGNVTSVALIKSSGYEAYDKVLLDGVRGWKFKTGDAVCSAVAFAFKPGK